MEKTFSQSGKKIILGIVVAVSMLLPTLASAAMLALSPVSGTYAVGKTFSVQVKVSSYSQAINAASGTLSYPTDLLSVVSVSKSGSLLTNWLPPGVNGPVSTPSRGVVTFEGITLSEYQGAPKALFTVVFRVKAEGTADIKFQDGVILASDGNGTDVTQALGTARFMLVAAPKEEPKPEPQPEPTPPVVEEPVVTTPVVETPEVAPTRVVSPLRLMWADQYFRVMVIGFGILLILIVILAIRVSQLSRKIRRIQARRAGVVRRNRHASETDVPHSPISF